MVPLQLPGGPELVIVLVIIVLNFLLLLGVVGGFGYFLLRVRSGGSVDERLDRIERKIGRLEARVERPDGGADVDRRPPDESED